jgi:hypothetical protein
MTGHLAVLTGGSSGIARHLVWSLDVIGWRRRESNASDSSPNVLAEGCPIAVSGDRRLHALSRSVKQFR